MTTDKSFFIPSMSNKPLISDNVFEGGFGKVYITKAVDGNKYALKTLKWELNLDKEIFYKETKKLLDIPPHKNVIQIIDIIHENGLPFICMPYCKSNLRQEMQKGKIETKQAELIVSDLAKGLTHIHTVAKVLHLDLKPENILIDNDDNYLLSDFGISKVLPELKRDSIQSKLFLSQLSGTITYMSPEHFVSQEVSEKSDVFALGIIIYELLTGKHPFLSNDLDQTVKNVLFKQISFSTIETFKFPKTLRQICLCALNKNPFNRPSSQEIFEFISDKKGNFHFQDEFDFIANINRANSLVTAGRFEEAQKLYNKCIESNPYNHVAYLNLAELYFRQSKFKEAVDTSEKLLGMTEWDKSNISSLGTLYTNLSHYYMVYDPVKSISLAKKALIIDPNDWQALGNLAESCRAIGESNKNIELLEEGLVACKKALKINPKDLKLRITYGGILLAKGDINTLLPIVIEVSNEAGDNYAPARFLLIRSLIFTGQIDDALRYLKAMRGIPELKNYIIQLDKEIATRKIELLSS